MTTLSIFIGGGIGALARYGVSLWTKNLTTFFPIGTFISNLMACLVVGYVMGISLKHPIPTLAKAGLLTGFCGGFSTFSTFSLENLELIEKGMITYTLVNTIASVVFGLLFVYFGIILTKS